MRFHTFGTGPASGWPAYGYPTSKRRRPSTYGIDCGAKVLLDAGSVEAVMDAVTRFGTIDTVLLSHAHNDHWAGLNNLRWGPPTPIYLTRETLLHPYFKEIADKPFSLRPVEIEFFKEIKIGEMRVVPFPLNHIEGTSGFLIECGTTLAYALDTNGLPEKSLEYLKGKVEYLVIDSALPVGESGLHNTYLDALRIGKELNVKKVFATHLLPIVKEDEVSRAAEELGVDVVIPDDNQEFKL